MFYLSTQSCIGLRSCSAETGTSLGIHCTVYQLTHTSVMMAVDHVTAAKHARAFHKHIWITHA